MHGLDAATTKTGNKSSRKQNKKQQHNKHAPGSSASQQSPLMVDLGATATVQCPNMYYAGRCE